MICTKQRTIILITLSLQETTLLLLITVVPVAIAHLRKQFLSAKHFCSISKLIHINPELLRFLFQKWPWENLA